MLTNKQLKNLYIEFVLTTSYVITNDPIISTRIKWLTYYIMKNDRKEATKMYYDLIKERANVNNEIKENILNKYDTTNTTNGTL